jgi:hypothetical protein
METLLIDGTEETPQVEFNTETSVYSISGRSLPEDATKFYDQLVDWVKAFSEKPKSEFTLNINLDYFNSSSAKQLVELMILLEVLDKKDCKVEIIWLYEEEDELMETRGKEIESIIDLPFTFSPIRD